MLHKTLAIAYDVILAEYIKVTPETCFIVNFVNGRPQTSFQSGILFYLPQLIVFRFWTQPCLISTHWIFFNISCSQKFNIAIWWTQLKWFDEVNAWYYISYFGFLIFLSRIILCCRFKSLVIVSYNDSCERYGCVVNVWLFWSIRSTRTIWETTTHQYNLELRGIKNPLNIKEIELLLLIFLE